MKFLKLNILMIFLISTITQGALAQKMELDKDVGLENNYLKDNAVASGILSLAAVISESKFEDAKEILKSGATKKILRNARFLKNFARVSGMTSAALAGYEIGELFNEYDEKHWNGYVNYHFGEYIGPKVELVASKIRLLSDSIVNPKAHEVKKMASK